MSKQDTYGLMRLYEMIINTNPSVAYLQSNNSLLENRMVVAHCYGHSHFFKNSLVFRPTDLDGNNQTHQTDPKAYNPRRNWLDVFGSHRTRVNRLIDRYGINKVEQFIDYCLSVENLIDFQAPFAPKKKSIITADEPEAIEVPKLKSSKPYMDDWINPEDYVEETKQKMEAERDKKKKFPEKLDRDVLSFLLEHANLETWEREILQIIRTEAYYFAPQRQTKIMNEGTAVFLAEQPIMNATMGSDEFIDYADDCSKVLATSKNSLNPYKLGFELLKNIKERWDKGRFGPEWESLTEMADKENWDLRLGLGDQKVKEVIAMHTDQTFIDEFLTEDFAREQKLFTFAWSNRNSRYEIESREFASVKARLLQSLTNGGSPSIGVEDANYLNRGELLLKHEHYGQDLRKDYAKATLEALVAIWHRPVCIITRVEDQPVLYRCDGKEHTMRNLR